MIHCWQKGYGRWVGHGALDCVSVTWALSHLFEISMEVDRRWPDRSSDRNLSFFSMCVSAKLLQSCQTLRAHQALLSMGFSRQEYWSELLCPPPGDPPDSGIKPCLLWLLHCRQILYRCTTGEAPFLSMHHCKSLHCETNLF